MAAPIGNVRIRLAFAKSLNLPLGQAQKCWILVQISETKSIDELQLRIVQKFGLGQGIRVGLWLDEYLLPSWENCGVLRENDLIRVEVEGTTPTSKLSITFPESSALSAAKRNSYAANGISCGQSAENLEDVPVVNCESITDSSIFADSDQRHFKKKKKKRKHLKEIEKEDSAIEMTNSEQSQPRKRYRKQSSEDPDKTSPHSCDVTDPAEQEETFRTTAEDEVIRNKMLSGEPITELKAKSEATVLGQESLTVGECAESKGEECQSPAKRKRKRRRRRRGKGQDGDEMCSKHMTEPTVGEEHGPTSSTPKEGWEKARNRTRMPSTSFQSGHGNHVIFDSESEKEEDTAKVSQDSSQYHTIQKPDEKEAAVKDSVVSEGGTAVQCSAGSKLWSEVPAEMHAPPSQKPQSSWAPTDYTASLLPSTITNGNKPCHLTIAVPLLSGKKNAQNSPFAGVTVFKRKKFKKQANYSLTREEQLCTTATNRSVVLQNTKVAQPVEETARDQQKVESMVSATSETATTKPEIDFTQCTRLHGPPRPGDKIAFKILELSDSYCPELSAYKTGTVLDYRPESQMVELELDSITVQDQGKFALTVEDENEVLTNCNVDTKVKYHWTSVVEPVLLPSPIR